MKGYSSELGDLLKKNLLKLGRDPADPKLLLLETGHAKVKYRFWIDPERGYLIVKKEVYWIYEKPTRREVLAERMEVVPKKFGDDWFIERGVSEVYNPDPRMVGDAAFPELVKFHEAKITVTNFQSGVKFKPGELEFSAKQFPKLEYITDREKNEELDVLTGRRKTWLKPERFQKPEPSK